MYWVFIRSAYKGTSDEYTKHMFLWRNKKKKSQNYHQILLNNSCPEFLQKLSITCNLFSALLSWFLCAIINARNIFATFFLSSNSSESRLLYSDNRQQASSTIPDNLRALSLSEIVQVSNSIRKRSGPSCSKRRWLNELVSGQNVNCSSKYNI